MENIQTAPKEILDTILINDEPLITNSSLDELIKESVKRDTLINVSMQDLFHEIEPVEEDFKYFNRCNFMVYYESLSLEFKKNLDILFRCINLNIELQKVRIEIDNYEFMHFIIYNMHRETRITLILPYDFQIANFVDHYIVREIFCNVSLEAILEHLDSNY